MLKRLLLLIIIGGNGIKAAENVSFGAFDQNFNLENQCAAWIQSDFFVDLPGPSEEAPHEDQSEEALFQSNSYTSNESEKKLDHTSRYLTSREKRMLTPEQRKERRRALNVEYQKKSRERQMNELRELKEQKSEVVALKEQVQFLRTQLQEVQLLRTQLELVTRERDEYKRLLKLQ